MSVGIMIDKNMEDLFLNLDIDEPNKLVILE
jgi:hypothetical protein